MKKLIFTLFAAVAVTAACTSVDKTEKEIQDSIAQAAEADSILNAAMAADTLNIDSLAVDSAAVDTLQ